MEAILGWTVDFQSNELKDYRSPSAARGALRIDEETWDAALTSTASKLNSRRARDGGLAPSTLTQTVILEGVHGGAVAAVPKLESPAAGRIYRQQHDLCVLSFAWARCGARQIRHRVCSLGTEPPMAPTPRV